MINKLSEEWNNHLWEFPIWKHPIKNITLAYQRAIYGYNDKWIYSADYSLSITIAKYVDELLEHVILYKITCGDMTHEEFVEILTKIRDSFIERHDLMTDFEEIPESVKEGMELLVKYYNRLWY